MRDDCFCECGRKIPIEVVDAVLLESAAATCSRSRGGCGREILRHHVEAVEQPPTPANRGLRGRKSGGFLDLVRLEARRLSSMNGSVSTDDLRSYTRRAGLKPSHPSVWGSVFLARGWRCIGTKKSEVKSNRHREIKVWVWEGK